MLVIEGFDTEQQKHTLTAEGGVGLVISMKCIFIFSPALLLTDEYPLQIGLMNH